jgi:hypothetical protein
VIVIINKVETLPDRTPVHETAELLLDDPAVEAVVMTALRRPEPVLAVWRR